MVVVLVVVVISSRLVDKNPGLLKPGTRAPIKRITCGVSGSGRAPGGRTRPQSGVLWGQIG